VVRGVCGGRACEGYVGKCPCIVGGGGGAGGEVAVVAAGQVGGNGVSPRGEAAARRSPAARARKALAGGTPKQNVESRWQKAGSIGPRL